MTALEKVTRHFQRPGRRATPSVCRAARTLQRRADAARKRGHAVELSPYLCALLRLPEETTRR